MIEGIIETEPRPNEEPNPNPEKKGLANGSRAGLLKGERVGNGSAKKGSSMNCLWISPKSELNSSKGSVNANPRREPKPPNGDVKNESDVNGSAVS